MIKFSYFFFISKMTSGYIFFFWKNLVLYEIYRDNLKKVMTKFFFPFDRKSMKRN